MLNSLLQFIKAPVFEDENQNTIASMLNAVLITALFSTSIISALIYFLMPLNRERIPILGWSFLAAIVLKLFIQLKYLRAAVLLSIFLGWALITSVVVNDFGVYAPSMNSYVIVILLAGMFLNKWGAIYSAIAVVVTNIGIVYFMRDGLIAMPESPPAPPEQVVMIYSFTFFITAALIFVARRSIEEALERDQISKQELLNALQVAKESEDRFRLISSVTSDYTFSSRYNAQGELKHTLLTGAFEAITGYTAEEFMKIGGWRESLHPDYLAQDDLDMATLQKNQSVISELRIIKKNGEIRWVRSYGNPVWDTEQNILLGINGGVQDITERKQAEQLQKVLFDISKARTETSDLHELLQYTHEKLRTLLKAKNFYVALYDPKTDIYTFPYGIDEEDVNWEPSPLKNSLTDYVRLTGKPIIITGETHKQLSEELAVDLVGAWSEVWIGAPLKTPRGIIGVMAIQDYESSSAYSQEDLDLLGFVSENIAWVIESKHNEEILTQERNLLRTIIDTIPEYLSVKDTQGRYILTNKANSELIGLRVPEDALGKVSYDLQFATEDEADLVEEKEVIETEHAITNHEKWVENPITGENHCILVNKIPFYDSEGRIAGLVALGHDITELKRAEGERVELELERKKVDFYREFIGSMTHDLKTPVATIKMSAYLLTKLSDPVKLEKQHARLNRQVERLQKMIDDILTVARLDYLPELTFEKINLNTFLEDIKDQLHTKAQQKNITLDLDLAPDLPLINAARDDLLRALLNLVENAVNYTPESGHVYLRSYLQGQSVICEIQDTGIGIDATALPHIFEQFFRAPNARKFEAGTGLGLAIVKKIVNLHQGKIKVSSILGEGTTFHLNIPCV
jgi:PAS domain S-box-containing protein